LPTRRLSRSIRVTAAASAKRGSPGRGLEVARHAPADGGQAVAELHELVELVARPVLRPERVVAVLLARPLVEARGLEVAVRQRAHPDVLVGRRHAELFEPLALEPPLDGGAVGREVRKTLAAAKAADARHGVGDIDEALGHLGLRRLGRRAEEALLQRLDDGGVPHRAGSTSEASLSTPSPSSCSMKRAGFSGVP
jgi:hypothetical protein